MKLTACCIFYNDAELLENMFLSLKECEIQCIAIDGKFRHYPNENLHSTDGSIEVAKKYADLYIPADESFLENQMTKRTRYIKEISNGEYFLVIDSDEELIGGKPNTKNLTLDTYALSIQEPQRNTTSTTIRVHKKYPDLIYAIRHCYMFYENQMNKKAVENLMNIYKEWQNTNYTDKNDFTKYIGERDAKLALTGCKTRRFEKNFLLNKIEEPLEIIHYPDKRKLERQNEDNIYLGNRDEINLNNFLAYPEGKPESRPYPKRFGNLNDNDMVTMQYLGNTDFPDANIGTLRRKNKYKIKFSYLQQLHSDFGPSNFKIIEAHKKPVGRIEEFINDIKDKFGSIDKRLEGIEKLIEKEKPISIISGETLEDFDKKVKEHNKKLKGK